MSLLKVIALVLVAIMAAFLWQWCETRMRRWITEDSGAVKPFDATSARVRIARVRRDYLAVVCVRSRARNRKSQLHAQFCRTVRARAYFRRHTTDIHPAAGEVGKCLAGGH
jgi:hypothetical protein